MPDAPPLDSRSFRTLGALYDGTAAEFRVWAPDALSVALALDRRARGRGTAGPDLRPLRRDDNGYWWGRFGDVGPGTRYRFRLDDDPDRTFPDPASRFQPEGVHGPSEVIDPARYRWTDQGWKPPPLERLVVYELHVGTFSPEGTFLGAIERLPHLVELGVTAVELMPVGDFPGTRGWGYDGVAIFAPARCYGTPDELRALVDAAHRLGLAVLLDVVYNHFGPDGAYANAFSPHYFSDAHSSPWGRGVNLDGPHSAAVRRFFIENALHWVDEYHVDGLRLDATHALQDDGPRHFLAELTATVRARARRPPLFVAEDHRNLAAMLLPVDAGGYGIDAVWADDFHHQLRVHTAGDREGYYGDFTGSIHDIAATIEQGWFYTGQWSPHLRQFRGTDPSALDPQQFVVCIQNHDQIGNRADGARLHHQVDAATYRALSALLLLAPQTPLLFMGQEWSASAPFLYFTDHHEELGRAVTEGRRREFRSFAAFSDPARRALIPDPQAAETFERCRLDWNERFEPAHAGVLQLYRRLLALRLSTPALVGRSRETFVVRPLDAHTLALCYTEAPLLAVVRLSGGAGPIRLGVSGQGDTMLTTEDPDLAADPRPVVVQRADTAAFPSGPHGWELLVEFSRPGAVIVRASLAVRPRTP